MTLQEVVARLDELERKFSEAMFRVRELRQEIVEEGLDEG